MKILKKINTKKRVLKKGVTEQVLSSKNERMSSAHVSHSRKVTIMATSSTNVSETYTFSSIFPNEEIMKRAFKIIHGND